MAICTNPTIGEIEFNGITLPISDGTLCQNSGFLEIRNIATEDASGTAHVVRGEVLDITFGGRARHFHVTGVRYGDSAGSWVWREAKDPVFARYPPKIHYPDHVEVWKPPGLVQGWLDDQWEMPGGFNPDSCAKPSRESMRDYGLPR